MSAPSDHNAIQIVPVARLRAYANNVRTHSKRQIRQIADSIREFGFTNPVLISDDDEILAGHGRVAAARLLGMPGVPALRLSHLDAAQRRAYVIADNKLALNAGWEREVLATELQALVDVDLDAEITVSSAELEILCDQARTPSPGREHAADDEVPPVADPVSAVTECGDLWLLDRHRLLCGDPRDAAIFDHLASARFYHRDPRGKACAASPLRLHAVFGWLLGFFRGHAAILAVVSITMVLWWLL
jgi:hypothetical protein